MTPTEANNAGRPLSLEIGRIIEAHTTSDALTVLMMALVRSSLFVVTDGAKVPPDAELVRRLTDVFRSVLEAEVKVTEELRRRKIWPPDEAKAPH